MPPLVPGRSTALPDHSSDGQHAGCLDLLRELQERVQPLLHVFGHIHEGYGVTTNGKTLFANASTCNLAYRPLNPALVFDLVPPARG